MADNLNLFKRYGDMDRHETWNHHTNGQHLAQHFNSAIVNFPCTFRAECTQSSKAGTQNRLHVRAIHQIRVLKKLPKTKYLGHGLNRTKKHHVNFKRAKPWRLHFIVARFLSSALLEFLTIRLLRARGVISVRGVIRNALSATTE